MCLVSDAAKASYNPGPGIVSCRSQDFGAVYDAVTKHGFVRRFALPEGMVTVGGEFRNDRFPGYWGSLNIAMAGDETPGIGDWVFRTFRVGYDSI